MLAPSSGEMLAAIWSTTLFQLVSLALPPDDRSLVARPDDDSTGRASTFARLTFFMMRKPKPLIDRLPIAIGVSNPGRVDRVVGDE